MQYIPDHPLVQVLTVALAIALALTGPVKICIDALRMNVSDLPGWAYAASAFVAGVVLAELLLLGSGNMTVQNAATCGVGGFLAGAGAVAATSAHKLAQAERDDAKAKVIASKASGTPAAADPAEYDRTG